MKAKELITKVLVGNPKTIVSVFAMMLLICGIQGVGYAADPVFGTVPDLEVNENAPDTNVGDVVPVTDEDDDTLNYRLEDPDSAPFTAVRVPATGEDPGGVQLKTRAGAAGTLDYETKSSYTVTIIASDGTEDVEQRVTITVINKNEAPTFTDGDDTRRSIAEDAATNANVGGAVSATDPDGTIDVNPEITGDNPNLTYTLDAATVAAGVFEIGLNDGQLTLVGALDYETKGIYQVTITVADDDDSSETERLTDEITVLISVTDANDLPMFPSETATREIAENTAADMDIGDVVEATDQDRDTLTYTHSGTNAALFAIDRNTGQLKTKGELDHETGPEYVVTVTVSDGNGGSDSITVTITITNANDAPMFTHGESTRRQINEDQEAGANITNAANGESGPVEATDPDGADTNPDIAGDNSLTYVLGGTDAASFAIVATSGQLQTKEALDHETKSSYAVEVTVYDGPSTDSKTLSDTINVTIRVMSVNEAPMFPSDTTTRSVPENAPGVDIGIPVTATDPDADDSLTYEITGSNPENFEIVSGTGQLRTPSSPLNFESEDFESEPPSYDVMVTATDSESLRDTITVTITVTDVNEAPEEFDPPSFDREIPENTAADLNIGDPISTTDPDTGQTLTYTLGGLDAGSFDIDGETGQLKTKAALDWNMKVNYEVTVTATDPGGLSVTTTVAITVERDSDEDPPENDAPKFSVRSTTEEVEEGDTPDRPVGSVVATGGTSPLKYSLEGRDAASFDIVEDSGLLQTKAALDFETRIDYEVIVKVEDSADPKLSNTINVAITVEDVDEVPVFTETTPIRRSVSENTVAGVNIGDPVSATGPAELGLRYEIVSGAGTNFAIDTETGQLKTAMEVNLDHETDTSHTVTVQAEGDEGSDTIVVTITVTDVNDAPVFGDIPPLTVAENTAAGTNIGAVVPVSDQDEDDLTYSLGGPDGSSFDFEKMVSTAPAENGVQLQTKAALDFETKEDYTVTITADDGNGGRATVTVPITVTDVTDAAPANSAPVFTGGLTKTYPLLAEDTATVFSSRTLGGQDDLEAMDGDTDDEVTYTLGGLDAALFKFDDTNNQLQTKAELDYETKSVYTVIVIATDEGGLTDRITVTITLDDVNEDPVFADETATFTVAENTAPGVVIGTVPAATDVDAGDDLGYTADADTMGFGFDSVTRELKTGAALNHEAKDEYEVTVTASDGSLTDTITVTINVTDVNEAPAFALDGSMSRSVLEGTAAETAIGDPVKATDPDDGDTLRYTLGGVDMSSFAIESTIDGGQLKTRAGLDYERKTDYEVMITVTDRDGLTDEATVTIKVRNDQSDDSSVTNRPPEFVLGRSKTYEVVENTAKGHNLGTVRATDPGQTVTYTLGGDDSASFEFDTTLEQLKTKVALDYEAKPIHTATITASDGSLTDEIKIILNVMDVNEAPTFASDADTTLEVDENTAVGTTIGAVFATTDPEGDDLMYSVGGPDRGFFDIDKETGQLEIRATLDHEALATRMVTVMVSDGTHTAELMVTITVGDVNEAPAFSTTAPMTLEVAENTAKDTDIPSGTYKATDPEDDDLTYDLVGPDGASFASEVLDKGGIKLKTKEGVTLDFEARRDYEVMITVSDGSLMDSVTVIIRLTDVTTGEGETDDPNEAPRFARRSATLEVAENTAAGENIGELLVVTDDTTDVIDLAYTLSDVASFDIEKEATGVRLKTKAVFNYEADPKTYMVEITASDGVLTDTIRVTINLMNVNEVPTFEGTSPTRSIQENVGKGASIGPAVSATDPDGGGGLVYSLDLADLDAAAFDIDEETGQLKTKAALDHETKDSYTVTVVAYDGALEGRITVTITIDDENDAPMFASDTAERRVQENDPDLEVTGGAVTATDPDNDTLTYSVTVGGTNFGIDSDGVLKTRVALDYEGARDYEVTVTARDPSGLSDTIMVVIKVTNDIADDSAVENSAPYFDAPRTQFSIKEDAGPGDPIGTVKATDDDEDDMLTYALTGTDRSSFNHEILADGGGLQLEVKEGVLDFETKDDYEVTVTVRDSKNAAGNTDSAIDDSIIVTIKVLNDPNDDDPESNRKPYFTSTSTTRSVEAGAGVRDILPEVIATDPEDDELKYSITGGTGASRFTIVSTSGKLRTNVALTGGDTHEVIVGVTDNKGPTGEADNTVDDRITVSISVSGADTDANDPAEFVAGSSVRFSIEEGTSGRTVGSLTVRDAESDPLTYVISSGNAAGLFRINNIGQLTTAQAVTPSSHTLTVTVSDRKNANDDPDDVVDDRITVRITVRAAGTPDPGGGDTTPDQPGGIFVPPRTPPVTPVTPGTTDNAPTFADGASTTREVAENTPAGQNIGSPVSATDPNGDTLTYALGGTDAASFDIDSTNGQLKTRAALDYETKSSYSVAVDAKDASITTSITVTINVTDVAVEDTPITDNVAPEFASETSARSIAENTAAGGAIGTPVAATDSNTGDVLTYTLGGTDAASFGINAATGQLMTQAMLDYETKDSYTVMVTATDKGGLTDSITVTITVTDVNDAPMFADETATREIAENTAADMMIGDAFMATDPDDGDELTYSLGGTDAASFAIDGTTRQLMTMAMLDHETKASHTVMIIATDTAGLTGSITVTISVLDVNDAPMFASDTATRMVEENTAADMTIGDPVTAMDDDGDDVTYSLGGDDMASFAIDAATGQLKTMAALDHETKASHTVMVTASDGTDMSSITVTIMVTDVPEFMLAVPARQSLIHIPLKMAGLAKISDLYDKLGGAANVNNLITRDAANDRWNSYLGPEFQASVGDKTLTDDLGILADMKNAVTLQLSGDPLGTDGVSSIMLQTGTNLVGVPLKDSRITNVSDLLGLDGIEDNVGYIIVSDGGEYKTITRARDPGDVAVTGGQSFILEATEAATVTITGDGWASSAATAAPSWISRMGIQKEGVTAALAVTGSIVDEVKGLTDFHITVKNLSTGKVGTVATSDDGVGYQLTFVDIETGRAAQIGDHLEISARSADPLVGVEPLRRVVTAEDVKRGHIQLDTLVTYEIPAKTELLRNYPNPFNPETWIPYRLAKDATVTLEIYDTTGGIVRNIHIGHQIAAIYESRSKAIYWDGRNNLGERVASGIYFYHLSAGDYSAARKMVILK